MSINDYVMADGIEVVRSGENWSAWHEPATSKWRFDIMDGNGQHWAHPAKGEMTPEWAALIVDNQRMNAIKAPQFQKGYEGLKAFMEERWPAAN